MKKYILPILLFLLISPVSGWAADYYVDSSCADTNPASTTFDGTEYDPATPACTGGSDDYYASLADLEAKRAGFAAGDNIYFRKGQIFRGHANLEGITGAAGSRITFTSFGTGAAPQIMNSVEQNTESDWVDQTGNLWIADDGALTVDVGNIIFDNSSTAIRVTNEGDVDADLEYWYDATDDEILIYSATNPATRFTDVEVVLASSIFLCKDAVGLTFEKLDLKYAGKHAFWFRDATDITVQDNRISWIGGGESSMPTRWGNGVEFWDGAEDCIVRRNYLYNIYDAAITCQGSANDYTVDGVYIYDNIIHETHYGTEFFTSGSAPSITNVYVYNNTFVNIDGPWSAGQRDPRDGSWEDPSVFRFGVNVAGTAYTLKNNIVYETRTENPYYPKMIHMFNTTLGTYTFDYNLYYATGAGDYFQIDDSSGYSYAEFSTYQSTESPMDANSSVGDPLFTASASDDFTLLQGSPARHGAVYISGYTTRLRPEASWPSTVTTMEDILSIGAYGVYRGAAGM